MNYIYHEYMYTHEYIFVYLCMYVSNPTCIHTDMCVFSTYFIYIMHIVLYNSNLLLT